MRNWQFGAGTLFFAAMLAALVAGLGGAATAGATPPATAVIQELTVFGVAHEPPVGTFAASGLPGCTSGSFSDQVVSISPSGATLVLGRTYACAGGGTLRARVALHLGTIDANGQQTDAGSWRIIAATGGLAGLVGSGSTSGISSGCTPTGSIFGACTTAVGTTTASIRDGDDRDGLTWPIDHGSDA